MVPLPPSTFKHSKIAVEGYKHGARILLLQFMADGTSGVR